MLALAPAPISALLNTAILPRISVFLLALLLNHQDFIPKAAIVKVLVIVYPKTALPRCVPLTVPALPLT